MKFFYCKQKIKEKKEKGERVNIKEKREELKSLGVKIRQLREASGLSRKELADALGMHYARLQMIENGTEKAVGPKTQEKIMKFFENCHVGSSAITVGGKNNVQVAGGHSIIIGSAEKQSPIDDLVPVVKEAMRPEFQKKVEAIIEALGVDEDHAIRVVLEAMRKDIRT